LGGAAVGEEGKTLGGAPSLKKKTTVDCISYATGRLASAPVVETPIDPMRTRGAVTSGRVWQSISSVRSVRSICFFQAEDGIRDLTVTGVQTCALPISPVMAATGTNGSAARTACPLRGTSPS